MSIPPLSSIFPPFCFSLLFIPTAVVPTLFCVYSHPLKSRNFHCGPYGARLLLESLSASEVIRQTQWKQTAVTKVDYIHSLLWRSKTKCNIAL